MNFSQKEILATIPIHLRQFVEHQDYTRYTSQDHAVWRYIMRQHLDHLRKYAHPLYEKALAKTGIAIDHVPSIEEMNTCLSKLGWRAIVVNGYIPASAFMEFHSHKILPIALDMRTIEHIHYTPAPDIVHEAAGHAPFIADMDYAEYLQKFGLCGHKAMYTKKDLAIYESIRHLSIIKEIPSTPKEEIDKAEKALTELMASDTSPSESSKLTRLFWWTAEYGLVGEIDHYKIFGAGLLSSIGESRSCLDDRKVKKIPLTVDCVNTAFDITEPQPQLFVTKSCKHMSQVLDEFSENMCFRKGGVESIRTAIVAEIVATCEYSSGLQVSGQFTKLLTDAADHVIYIGTTGPTQLAYHYKELPGHGTHYHSQGFGSPVGNLQNIQEDLQEMSVDELKKYGIEVSKEVTLEFLSGITVKGWLENILREGGKNLIFTFKNCTVTDLEGQVLFQPDWGNYDMAVGKAIVSVYSGSADREKFDIYPPKSGLSLPKKKFSEKEKQLFVHYQNVRDMRDAKKLDIDQLKAITSALTKDDPKEWLLRLEIYELVADRAQHTEFSKNLLLDLEDLKKVSHEYRQWIEDGLKVL